MQREVICGCVLNHHDNSGSRGFVTTAPLEERVVWFCRVVEHGKGMIDSINRTKEGRDFTAKQGVLQLSNKGKYQVAHSTHE